MLTPEWLQERECNVTIKALDDTDSARRTHFPR